MHIEAPPAPALSYTFTWDRKEFARFYRQLVRHARLSGFAKLATRLFPLLIAFTTLDTAYVAATRGIGAASGMIPWALVLLFWLGLFRLFTPGIVARQWEKQNCCVAHPMTRSLADDGLRVHCSMRDMKLAWPGIRRVVETKEFLIFFQTDRCAHYLPKRAIGSADELQRVRDFLIRHTPVQKAKDAV